MDREEKKECVIVKERKEFDVCVSAGFAMSEWVFLSVEQLREQMDC